MYLTTRRHILMFSGNEILFLLSEGKTVLDTSNSGIQVSDPARGLDLCPCCSIFCYPRYVKALRSVDTPSEELVN
jgi:hypothetical protein